MKVMHTLIEDLSGFDEEQIEALGNQLFVYNARSHGDTEDDMIFVEGKLYQKPPEPELTASGKRKKTTKTNPPTWVFLFKTPMGWAQHEGVEAHCFKSRVRITE
jgi:hypothetical protein